MRKLIVAAAAFLAFGPIFAAAKYFMNDQVGNDAEVQFPAMEAPWIVIEKAKRKLAVFDGELLIAEFGIGLGLAPDGDKAIEGDGRTPEGDFYVFTKNPESRFFLSLGISYPSREDAERGFAEGLISEEEHRAIADATDEKRMPPQKTKLGGEIYIHGGGEKSDWTEGCIALKNNEMQALFDAIPIGTPVTIKP
ncbi:MAG: L,D-transpeptidase [Acidobacteria bacterium]|nr:L,D-transpeptidase [Acidobacteriota bacterium]